MHLTISFKDKVKKTNKPTNKKQPQNQKGSIYLVPPFKKDKSGDHLSNTLDTHALWHALQILKIQVPPKSGNGITASYTALVLGTQGQYWNY